MLKDAARHIRSRTVSTLRSSTARRALSLRLLAALICTSIAIWVARSLSEAAELRADWGQQVPVLVALHDIEAGEPVGASDVVSTIRPRALHPKGAVRELEPGTTATTEILAGEPLVGARLSSDQRSMAHGTTAMSLDLALPPPELRSGDHIDVLGASGARDPLDPLADRGDAPTGIEVISSRAVVLRAPNEEEPTIEIGVPGGDVPAITEAALRGGVAVVRR